MNRRPAKLEGEALKVRRSDGNVAKIDECVEIAALPQLSAIYRRILEQLLA